MSPRTIKHISSKFINSNMVPSPFHNNIDASAISPSPRPSSWQGLDMSAKMPILLDSFDQTSRNVVIAAKRMSDKNRRSRARSAPGLTSSKPEKHITFNPLSPHRSREPRPIDHVGWLGYPLGRLPTPYPQHVDGSSPAPRQRMGYPLGRMPTPHPRCLDYDFDFDFEAQVLITSPPRCSHGDFSKPHHDRILTMFSGEHTPSEYCGEWVPSTQHIAATTPWVLSHETEPKEGDKRVLSHHLSSLSSHTGRVVGKCAGEVKHWLHIQKFQLGCQACHDKMYWKNLVARVRHGRRSEEDISEWEVVSADEDSSDESMRNYLYF